MTNYILAINFKIFPSYMEDYLFLIYNEYNIQVIYKEINMDMYIYIKYVNII